MSDTHHQTEIFADSNIWHKSQFLDLNFQKFALGYLRFKFKDSADLSGDLKNILNQLSCFLTSKPQQLPVKQSL